MTMTELISLHNYQLCHPQDRGEDSLTYHQLNGIIIPKSVNVIIPHIS